MSSKPIKINIFESHITNFEQKEIEPRDTFPEADEQSRQQFYTLFTSSVESRGPKALLDLTTRVHAGRGLTIFEVAVLEQRVDLIKWLIGYVDKNFPSERQYIFSNKDLLFLALEGPGEALELINILIQENPELIHIERVTRNGTGKSCIDAPLPMAMERGKGEVAKLLLVNGANLLSGFALCPDDDRNLESRSTSVFMGEDYKAISSSYYALLISEIIDNSIGYINSAGLINDPLLPTVQDACVEVLLTLKTDLERPGGILRSDDMLALTPIILALRTMGKWWFARGAETNKIVTAMRREKLKYAHSSILDCNSLGIDNYYITSISNIEKTTEERIKLIEEIKEKCLAEDKAEDGICKYDIMLKLEQERNLFIKHLNKHCSPSMLSFLKMTVRYFFELVSINSQTAINHLASDWDNAHGGAWLNSQTRSNNSLFSLVNEFKYPIKKAINKTRQALLEIALKVKFETFLNHVESREVEICMSLLLQLKGIQNKGKIEHVDVTTKDMILDCELVIDTFGKVIESFRQGITKEELTTLKSDISNTIQSCHRETKTLISEMQGVINSRLDGRYSVEGDIFLREEPQQQALLFSFRFMLNAKQPQRKKDIELSVIKTVSSTRHTGS